MATQDQVLDAMRGIIDPDLGRDIVSLGFIKDLAIDGGTVRFKVELTTPACPVKDRFKQQCEDAVGALPGVERVEVSMTARQPRQQSDSGINTLEGVNSIVAVSSCKGGVGKSTVAAHLARAMQRSGLAVALLDADVYGPSVPTLFNMRPPGVQVKDDLIQPIDADGLKLMSMGFLLGDSPAVLRGPIVSNYMQQVLRQTEWGKLDYLVIDLPPGTGDIQLTIVQQVALDGAVIVTTPQTLSLVDVARGILMFNKVDVPVLGIVDNMASFTCDGCGKVHHPFGKPSQRLQEAFGLPTLAELPIAMGVANVGEPEEALLEDHIQPLAEKVHRAIGITRAGKVERPEIKTSGSEVVIHFPGGESLAFANHALRCASPSAENFDEFTGERLVDPADIPQDVQVESYDYLGNYAVAFKWSDGHTTGIYSWDYLKRLAKEAG